MKLVKQDHNVWGKKHQHAPLAVRNPTWNSLKAEQHMIAPTARPTATAEGISNTSSSQHTGLYLYEIN